MTDPLLREAAHALRDLSSEPAARPQATRARVMMSLHRRRRQVWRKAGLFAPFAVILAGSSAWAAVFTAFAVVFVTSDDSDPKPPAPVETVELPADPTPVVRKPDRKLEERAIVETKEEDEDGPVEVENVLPTPEETVVQTPVVAPAPPPRHTVEPPKEAPVRSVAPAPPRIPADEPGMDLYRAAHRAHFVDRDPAGALAAWDAYLRAAPRGRFATEARYNRALTLVRLGRHAEAARALEPFADGRYGGYRQSEARALLGELE